MSRWSDWRVPLRVARRDALRSRGRSVLIVAMIAIPVLGLGAVDVMYRTITIDLHERVNLDLGTQADAWIRATPDGSSGAVEQSIDANNWSSGASSSSASPRSLTELLPAGSHLAPVGDITASVVAPHSTVGAVVSTKDDSVDVVVADERDALVAGRYPFSGSAPTTTSEVLASRSFLNWRHLHVGSDVDLATDGAPSKTYRIVGVLHDRSAAPANHELLALPGAVAVPADPSQVVYVGKQVYQNTENLYLVSVPGGVTWPQVLKLNAQGYLVFSREVIAHPPAKSDVPFAANQQSGGPLSVQTLFGVLIGVLVVGLALLEVCLLAGAAFAVGVRRQTRTVGLLSASGADARGIRRMVRAQGLVLGMAAAVVGVPTALILAWLALPRLERIDRYTVYGPFDLRPLELLGIGLIAVVSGVAAAAIPARTASRLDPVRALAGRRGQARSPKRWPLIGVGLALFGTALSIAGAARVLSLYRSATGQNSSVYGAATMLVIGAALVQIGLIIATPAIIGAAGRLAAYLPLAPRLALRDASRNRGRAAPAVGAVLAAVAASSALTMYVASQDDHDRRHYIATLQAGQAQVSLQTYTSENAPPLAQAPIRAALASTLPLHTIGVVQTMGCATDKGCVDPSLSIPKANECPNSLGPDATAKDIAAQQRRLAGDWRCQFSDVSYASRFNGQVVGDASTVELVSGVHSAAAASVLAAGGVVVFNRADVLAGQATVDLFDRETGNTSETLKFPAVYLESSNRAEVQAVWSAGAAKKLGMVARDDSVVMTFTHDPRKAELKAANAAVRALGVRFDVYVEKGYSSNYGPGLLALVGGAALVTLLATGVATGLAQADARPDHATLSAVGASPGVRRRLAGAQSWSLALLGTLLGVVAGFVPATALMWARPDFSVIFPWHTLGLTILAVPLLAGLGALLLTRSRIPMDRRLT